MLIYCNKHRDMIMTMIIENDGDDDDARFYIEIKQKKESSGMGYFRVIIESCNKAK